MKQGWIICVKNDEKYIQNRLENCLTQQLQIILALSEDLFQILVVIPRKENGHSSVMRKGFR